MAEGLVIVALLSGFILGRGTARQGGRVYTRPEPSTDPPRARTSGYRPTYSLDQSNPPRGGSGVPVLPPPTEPQFMYGESGRRAYEKQFGPWRPEDAVNGEASRSG